MALRDIRHSNLYENGDDIMRVVTTRWWLYNARWCEDMMRLYDSLTLIMLWGHINILEFGYGPPMHDGSDWLCAS